MIKPEDLGNWWRGDSMIHFIEKCYECKAIISQCRCPSKDKELRWGICDDCKKEPMFEGVIAKEGGICGSLGHRWSREGIQKLPEHDDRIEVREEDGVLIAVIRVPHSEAKDFPMFKKQVEITQGPLDPRPTIPSVCVAPPKNAPVRCGECGVSKCPKCHDPLVVRQSMFNFRGKSYSGLVCQRCNALWDNPDDSFYGDTGLKEGCCGS